MGAGWGGRGVSNPLPPEPQSGALPGELRPPLKGPESVRPDRIALWRRKPIWPEDEEETVGRGREIRTPDILLPKQARYQTALYPE